MNKNIVLLGATSFIATNFIKNYRKNKIKACDKKNSKLSQQYKQYYMVRM